MAVTLLAASLITTWSTAQIDHGGQADGLNWFALRALAL